MGLQCHMLIVWRVREKPGKLAANPFWLGREPGMYDAFVVCSFQSLCRVGRCLLSVPTYVVIVGNSLAM